MSNSRGPVVVGMDITAGETAATTAAVDLAAREAVRRQVELRLVYGQVDLPSWPFTGQILDAVVARVTDTYPTLAITTGIYPGTATAALITASAMASLVVIASGTAFEDSTAIAGLTTGAMLNAPVVLVVAPATAEIRLDEPAFMF
jgi:hypothetical protein